MTKPFDLLTTIEYGGCSAKVPAGLLSELLRDLPLTKDPNLLVDVETHDDAGVYRISDDTALIFTTDFFPPICSDAREFGEIAAANALSDVYAMGGEPFLALNLAALPAELPEEMIAQIMLGSAEKAREAGCIIAGGHTVDDDELKYGLSVTGTIHPQRVLTKSGLRAGDRLVRTP